MLSLGQGAHTYLDFRLSSEDRPHQAIVVDHGGDERMRCCGILGWAKRERQLSGGGGSCSGLLARYEQRRIDRGSKKMESLEAD
jgi:hypothetical protein